MRLRRRIGIALLGCMAAAGAHTPVVAGDLWADLLLLGQVRDGDQSRETEAPVDVYGHLWGSDRWRGPGAGTLVGSLAAETYFRLERDLNTGENTSDFYAGYAQIPVAGVEATLGRQFLSEGPGGVFVADAGRLRIDRGWPVAFTVYGGAPQYFEPTYSTDIISQDEILFGGSMRTTRVKNGELSVGYQQWERESRVLRQLVSATAAQAFPSVGGLPKVYGAVGYDVDHQNLDMANLGVDFFLSELRLAVNLGATYYDPLDDEFVSDLNWREDAIFQLFSSSALEQVRSGVRYALTSTVSAYGDLSYQHYKDAVGRNVDGYLGSAGLLWLPEGDGLEVVRLGYYVADSRAGNVNGVGAYYENRVYDRILFEVKVDVAYYDKETNQDDVPVATITGLGYELAPGLLGELFFEANRNQRFDADLRFGFAVSYNFRHRVRPLPERRAS